MDHSTSPGSTPSGPEYPSKIFTRARPCVAVVFCLLINACCLLPSKTHATEIIETIIYQDSQGVEHEEYAFRAPMKVVPNHVLNMFCANVKVRLYWNVFREQTNEKIRKGIHLRRMARFARHLFEDIRDVDKPFNATMLSIIDERFGVNFDDNEKNGEETKDSNKTTSRKKPLAQAHSLSFKKLKALKSKLTGHTRKNSNQVEVLESSAPFKELVSKGFKDAAKRIKSYIAENAPKVGMGIYTRLLTMWWLMMSCLFTKYYLWDPALDEFTKLKRSLVMYPDFQLTKLRDIDCKPVKFFEHILDVCKILNPLMNLNFGELSLDRLTRFRSDVTKLQ